jgi:adenosylmethionine---8-amino-7-oxononanoate aminotransferase
MHKLAQLDHQYLWHPFTQMRDWLKREPIVIASGKGALLRDVAGKEYIDANASIWTNLHGHAHPKINRAIKTQLDKIAHSSALGLANEPASLLGERLIQSANSSFNFSSPSNSAAPSGPQPRLAKVFYSDNGSTAVEVALKLSYEYARRSGFTSKSRFLSLEGAYHGDTLGAVSVGHIDLFHKAYSGLLFNTGQVMAPYCYRCPFNRARPERADARLYRKCQWECVGKVETAFATARKAGRPYSALVVEPLMQGPAGMIAQPRGWLRQTAQITRAFGAQLIADEVMVGLGRAGAGLDGLDSVPINDFQPALFASHQEGVQPDYLALAKGLTAGYLPMAATLTTREVFDAFLGEYEEFKTFFHGHSFTANQLGAAAALASFDLLQTHSAARQRVQLERLFSSQLQSLWACPHIGDIRQAGLVAGIELVKNWRTRESFPLRERAGFRVCEAMAKRGVLTRPIGNVIVFMPPYCTTPLQLKTTLSTLVSALEEVLGPRPHSNS